MKYIYAIPKSDAVDAGIYDNIYLLHKIVTDIFDNGQVRFATRFNANFITVYIDTEVSYKKMPQIGVLFTVDKIMGNSASGIVSFRAKYSADEVARRLSERMVQLGISGVVSIDAVYPLQFKGKRPAFNYTPTVTLSVSGLSSSDLEKITSITLGSINNDRNYLGLIGIFPDSMQLSQIPDAQFVCKSSVLHSR